MLNAQIYQSMNCQGQL